MPQNDKTFFGPMHLNQHLLCALMCKLSGTNPDEHHITEIALMPINAAYKQHDHFPAFSLGMALDDDDEFDNTETGVLSTSKKRIAEIKLNGINRYTGYSIFHGWWETISTDLRNDNKRIVVLTHDWHLQMPFIMKWLGFHTFNSIFHVEQYRDLRSIALAMNDREDLKCEKGPFPKTDFDYLRTCMKVEKIGSDPLSLVGIMPEIYRNLLRSF